MSAAALKTGLAVQANVVGALLMREIHTRYGRDNIGYLWMFVEPAILTLAVLAIHAGAPGGAEGHGIDPAPFTIIGYSTFILFPSIFTRAEGILESNGPLLYHRQVTIFDMVLARALLELGSSLSVLALLLTAAVLFGYAQPPERPLAMLAGIAYLWIWSFGLALIVTAATNENRVVEKFVHPISYILLPLSGAFYMVSWLPQPYRDWVAKFPMTQMFELIRYGQFSAAEDTYVEPVYLAFWCAGVLLAGLLAVRAVRSHVQIN